MDGIRELRVSSSLTPVDLFRPRAGPLSKAAVWRPASDNILQFIEVSQLS